MASLLAFAWRKVNESNPLSSNDDHVTSFSLPDVSESSSGESATIDPPLEVTDMVTPVTPEGLRPRRCAELICRELNMPSNLLNSFESGQAPIQNEYPSLPPLNCRPLSLRSGNHSHHVAESPTLEAGKARTAVGALLAMSDGEISFHESTKDPASSLVKTSTGILPPRSWIDQDNEDDNESGKTRTAVGALLAISDGGVTFHESILPPRPWINQDGEDDNQSEYSEEPAYEAIFTPDKKRKSRIIESPTTSFAESSIHASPSSNNWRQSSSIWKQEQKDESSVTRRCLKEFDCKGKIGYDFHSIMDQDVYIAQTSESADLSAISHSTKDNESHQDLDKEEQGYYYQCMREEEDEMGEALRRQKTKNQRRNKEDLLISIFERLQDDTNLVSDVLNELKLSTGNWDVSMSLDSENIFTGFSKKTRAILCKNMDAVLKDMKVASPEDFTPLPSQIPNFADTYDDLEQALLFCRSLIGTAIPQSEKPEMDHFPGASSRHQWRCLPGLRSSLGFDEIPESPPTVRGGDSSLFSLPESEHDTPHTSNVSLTTTITSAWSPAKQSSSRRDEGSPLRRTVEAAATLFDRLSAACSKLVQISAPSKTSIRAAEEIKRIYLQLVTIHPDDMKALIDSFQLQLPPLLQISRMVSDDCDEQRADRRQSSGLALPPPVPLTRSSGALIRNPAQEIVARSLGIRFEAPRVNLIPEEEEGHEEEGHNLFSPTSVDMKSIEAPRVNLIPEEEERHNLFSPTTVDMKSIEDSRDEVEDVCRTVGSFHRQDNDERDGPPADEREPIATKRGKRSSWFRIRAHKTKVTE